MKTGIDARLAALEYLVVLHILEMDRAHPGAMQRTLEQAAKMADLNAEAGEHTIVTKLDFLLDQLRVAAGLGAND